MSTASNTAKRKEREAALSSLIRPMPNAVWSADFTLNYLESSLAGFAKDFGGCNLTPDFQRGHVWSLEQQERFIEALIRGTLPMSCMLIQFNCPHWDNDGYDGDLPPEVQCVDGLQRLTALRRYLRGEIRAFGFTVEEFTGTRYDVRRPFYAVKFAMHTFQVKAELLQFYLDLNAGGTPHNREEIERVRAMLGAARTACLRPD